jgi:CRP-like cAMP-binding protein
MVRQTPGEALRLPSNTFVRLSKELPNFRTLVLRYALCLLHEIARTAACNRLHSVEQRLARWLMLCSHRTATDSFPLTHEALASMLAARRPFITRTARALQQAGIIQYTRGTLRIVDRDRLAAISCEDLAAIEQEYARLLG